MMKEKGFTIIELVLTLAIGSIISAVAIGSIYNLMDTATRTQDVNKVLNNLDVAALQLRKDGFVAQETNFVEGTPKILSQGGANISIGWVDYTGYDEPEERTHNIVYSLSGGLLQRVLDSDNATVVGRDITGLSVTKNGRLLDVTLTATSATFPEVVRTLSFKTYMRSEGLQP